jgi:hypothetical protein
MLDEQSRLEAKTPYLYNFNQHALPVTDVACFHGAIAVSSSEDRTCKVRIQFAFFSCSLIMDSMLVFVFLSPDMESI